MKKKRFLIDGLSGTGKSTVTLELRKRGYTAFDADEAFAYNGDLETGEPLDDKELRRWLWNGNLLDAALEAAGDEVVFVCGGADDQTKYENRFNAIFTLIADDATITERLQSRTNNVYGKDPEELALQLAYNKGAIKYAKERGKVMIDATRPVTEVVDEILQRARECGLVHEGRVLIAS